MKITKVSLFRFRTEGSSEHLAATASITFDDCFMIHGVHLIETSDRRFLAMPYKRKPGKDRDVEISNTGKRVYNTIATCHPITKEFAKELEQQIFALYDTMPPNQRKFEWAAV